MYIPTCMYMYVHVCICRPMCIRWYLCMTHVCIGLNPSDVGGKEKKVHGGKLPFSGKCFEIRDCLTNTAIYIIINFVQHNSPVKMGGHMPTTPPPPLSKTPCPLFRHHCTHVGPYIRLHVGHMYRSTHVYKILFPLKLIFWGSELGT